MLLVVASGCCYCGTPFYDLQAHQTWEELERGLHSGPTSVDGDQTGVSIQLPVLFDSKETKTFRPGSEEGNRPIAPERVQPPGLTIPGLRFTCETIYRDDQGRKLPVYCYLAVLPKGSAERTKVKDQLLQAAKAENPTAQWEAAVLEGSSLSAEKLSFSGTQVFMPAGAIDNKQAVETGGRVDLYLVAAEHANVLVGFRAPIDIADRVSLTEAGLASIASIKSEKPAAPISATPDGSGPTGEFVQAPNTNIELVPPAGFTPAAAISGFEKSGTSSSIAVAPQTHPYEAMVGSYNPDTLKQYNITVVQREDVTVGGAPALLLLLQKPDQTYWNLVFGDASGSYVITATLANQSDEAEKQTLKSALLTARKMP
jgi:hypothetical protein